MSQSQPKPTTLAEVEVKIQEIGVLHAKLQLLFRGYSSEEIETMSDEEIVSTSDALIASEQ